MTDRLTEARDLLAKTEGHTPGPWRAVMDGNMHAVRCQHPTEVLRDYSVCIDPARRDVGLIAAAPTLRDLLAWAVGEVERLREREPYHEAHVELLRQFEQTALENLAEAKARMLRLEQQVVALRKVESTWGHRSAGKNEVTV